MNSQTALASGVVFKSEWGKQMIKQAQARWGWQQQLTSNATILSTICKSEVHIVASRHLATHPLDREWRLWGHTIGTVPPCISPFHKRRAARTLRDDILGSRSIAYNLKINSNFKYLKISNC